MKTELQESMTAGVFVEFQDACGNTIGQAVFTSWQGRPVPAVGDSLACAVRLIASGRSQKLAGCVVTRHFELQHDGDEPCVWARLIVQALVAKSAAAKSGVTLAGPARFSAN